MVGTITAVITESQCRKSSRDRSSSLFVLGAFHLIKTPDLNFRQLPVANGKAYFPKFSPHPPPQKGQPRVMGSALFFLIADHVMLPHTLNCFFQLSRYPNAIEYS